MGSGTRTRPFWFTPALLGTAVMVVGGGLGFAVGLLTANFTPLAIITTVTAIVAGVWIARTLKKTREHYRRGDSALAVMVAWIAFSAVAAIAFAIWLAVADLGADDLAPRLIVAIALVCDLMLLFVALLASSIIPGERRAAATASTKSGGKPTSR